ncbi:MAG: phage tail tube protein [Christensenellaceae bacterium]|nr:phage tail tube protein [Christensenellaceae bacterium]
MSAKRVINGTFGKVWLESEFVAECYKCQVKESYTRENVPMCGSLRDGKKLTKVEGTGSIGLYKVNSRMARLIADQIRAGHDPKFTIMSKLDDPDAYGAERVSLTGVAFNDLTIADWEAGVLGKVECPFTYEDHEFIDYIPEV